jgi:hypothetical protein
VQLVQVGFDGVCFFGVVVYGVLDCFAVFDKRFRRESSEEGFGD